MKAEHTPLSVLRTLLDSCVDEAQSEYDGRVYSYCTSCSANDLGDEGIKHRAQCVWELARATVSKNATGESHG